MSKPEVEGFRLVQTLNVVIIFIISGLTLKTDDIKTALSKEGIVGFGYGVVSTLLITACVGFAAAEIPFDKKEFAYGLAVFCVVPTTLSSGVTLVMNAGGNDALALLLTVTTNLLGVISVPFFVKAVLRSSGGASIDAVKLLIKLVVAVLIPLVIGKLVREAIPGAKPWVKKWKVWLSLTSTGMLVMVVWQTLSRAQDTITSVNFTEILSVIAAGIGLHFVYLAINWPACTLLKLKRREFKAVVLMTSQKTLPVTVTVISFLSSLGAEGLMTIPGLVAHMSQLFIDAYIAARWADDEPDQALAKSNGSKGGVGMTAQATV